MDWGFTTSLVIAAIAVVGVSVEIPIISDYAFWVLFGAFLLLAGIGYERARA